MSSVIDTSKEHVWDAYNFKYHIDVLELRATDATTSVHQFKGKLIKHRSSLSYESY